MIGNRIRELRERNNFLLRQLAAQLNMDTAMLSKMERGERFFKKEDIERLAIIFSQDRQELLVLWLADKVLKGVKEEEFQVEAFELVLKVLNRS